MINTDIIVGRCVSNNNNADEHKGKINIGFNSRNELVKKIELLQSYLNDKTIVISKPKNAPVLIRMNGLSAGSAGLNF